LIESSIQIKRSKFGRMTEENWKQLDDEMADLDYRLLGWHPGRSDGLSERTYVNNDSSRCVQFVQDTANIAVPPWLEIRKNAGLFTKLFLDSLTFEPLCSTTIIADATIAGYDNITRQLLLIK
jgi:hypothetical protein